MDSNETKIFDPADGFAPVMNVHELTDAAVVKRDNRWWMYLAGETTDSGNKQLFSASLPQNAPLSATGWQLTTQTDDNTKIAELAGYTNSKEWDFNGGRHCPSYVRGWDPEKEQWVERIYYAGGADQVWGPFTIGYLEWDGDKWVDQPSPAFVANEDWERGSVYEPNLIYHDGKWKMWYVAGSNFAGYVVQGYSESIDGKTNWSKHRIFVKAEKKVFDFCVVETKNGFEAVFSRLAIGDGKGARQAGLWWCEAKSPSYKISDWSKPVRVMTAKDCGWHSGPWKPSFCYSDTVPTKMFVFFDGHYLKTQDHTGFPYVFTSGCLELDRPV